jgi:hypothetical protein
MGGVQQRRMQPFIQETLRGRAEARGRCGTRELLVRIATELAAGPNPRAMV